MRPSSTLKEIQSHTLTANSTKIPLLTIYSTFLSFRRQSVAAKVVALTMNFVVEIKYNLRSFLTYASLLICTILVARIIRRNMPSQLPSISILRPRTSAVQVAFENEPKDQFPYLQNLQPSPQRYQQYQQDLASHLSTK